jgi:hypothetical protein
VRPFGLGDRTFDDDVIDLPVVIMMLPLGIEVGIRTSGDSEDCVVGGESYILLLGFLDLWQRWRWSVGFGFDLGVGVVLRWVGDLQNC